MDPYHCQSSNVFHHLWLLISVLSVLGSPLLYDSVCVSKCPHLAHKGRVRSLRMTETHAVLAESSFQRLPRGATRPSAHGSQTRVWFLMSSLLEINLTLKVKSLAKTIRLNESLSLRQRSLMKIVCHNEAHSSKWRIICLKEAHYSKGSVFSYFLKSSSIQNGDYWPERSSFS